MREQYIIGIDQSTQGTKALLFNQEGALLARSDRPHRQIIDERNFVEHDPLEIMGNVYQVAREVVEKTGVAKEQVVAIGISNQRETVVAWNRVTGKPVCNAVVWQCARAQAICDGLEKAGCAEKVREITGLNLSPYFAGPKMAWILQNCPEAQEWATAGQLCFGTIDSWLLFNLTNGRCFKTDCSNASRTMLMELENIQWSDELCTMFGIDKACLPEICPSDSLFGMTDLNGWLDTPIPVHSMMGDSHAALYGQGCHERGMIKATYGTGSSIMMNVGEKIARGDGIVSSVGWGENGQVQYVLEGNINYTGAVITWIKDDLGLISSAKESGQLAVQANPADTTYIVPAFSGLGAPYWDADAKAVICGITRTTGKKEIVRAAEDCIAHQIADVVEAMADTSGVAIRELRVDGGPTRDTYLMQFQSDMLDRHIQVPDVEELSGLGAAYMAGIAAGALDRTTVFARIERTTYAPKMDAEEREAKRTGWKAAVAQVLTK